MIAYLILRMVSCDIAPPGFDIRLDICFLEEKAHFFGSKTADQRFDEMQKKTVFLLKFAAKFLLF